MKYNKIFRAGLMLVAASMLMPSCKFEEDDYFDESASLRIQHTNETIQKELVAASADGQNGWLIQYFTAGTGSQIFEGFNIFGRFYSNGKVELSSNHRFLRNGNANKYTTASSLYEMLQDEGPVLAFNSWNDVLTVFVDPVNPSYAPNSVVSDGVGMQGDQNLVVLSYSDSLMEMRGERHGGKVRFVKLDCTPAQYLDKVSAKKAEFNSDEIDNYYLINGTDTMFITGLSSGVFQWVDRLEDPLKTTELNCIFTPTGFRTQNVEDFNGGKFQEFTVSADKTCLQAKESAVKLVALWDQYIINTKSYYTIDLANLSTEQKAAYDKIAEVLKSINAGWSLQSVAIGQSTGGDYVNGIVFTLKTQATTPKTIGMSMDMKRTGFAQMTLSESAEKEYDINLGIIDDMTTEDMKALMQEFAATLYGTYTMTPDNYFFPTSATLTSAEGKILNITKK